MYRILSLALVASIIGSFAATGFMLAVSRLNYPGAEALNRLHALVPEHHSPEHHPVGKAGRIVNVHMDTLSCMTGITRFLQLPAPPLADLESAVVHGTGAGEKVFWVYDKTEEDERLLDPLFWERFDWVLAERPEKVIGRWEIVETVYGYAGMRVLRPGEDEGDEMARGLRDVGTIAREGDVQAFWELVERYGRAVTRGWWVGERMEPRIRILKREREKAGVVLPMGGDW